MPSADFSKDITSLFNNSQISNSLKLDVACRFICDTLGTVSVSILLYDSIEDNLACRGSYLAKKDRSAFSTNNVLLEEVINNIAVFEYFNSQLYEKKFSEITVSDFQKSITFGTGMRGNDYSLPEDQFTEFKNKWESGLIKNTYKNYKDVLRTESHYVSEDTISGDFYLRLLQNKNYNTEHYEIRKLREGPQKGKLYFDVWDHVGISLPKENLYYVGLPLYSNERYTGILRLVFSVEEESTISQLIFSQEELNKKRVLERLNNFAQLLSLHLTTEYYLSGYRELLNLKIDINDDLQVEYHELSEVCNTLCRLINCQGCIIRFSEKKDNRNPPIKAISKSLTKYRDYALSRTGKDGEFSEDIYNILMREKHSSRVIGLCFSVDDVKSNRFDITLYYFDKSGKLEYESEANVKIRDFTPEYNKKLHELKIRRILVIPIEDVTEGILVLTNTENRIFTASDVEMILLASKRFQLELKQIQEIFQKKEAELQKAQISGMNIVMHQFGQVVKSSSDTIEEMKDKIDHFIKIKYKTENRIYDEFYPVLQNFKLLKFLIIQSQNQITTAQRINKIDIEPLQPIRIINFDFYSFIKDRCKDFEPYADIERGLHIRLINTKRVFEKIIIDEELLTEVIYSLLDNAVKYSYSSIDMKRFGINFNPADYSSDGNIKVSYTINTKSLSVSVTNWGYTIPITERYTIFERSRRGSNSTNTVGSGLGLYLSKKIIDSLEGNIYVESSKHKTTFTFTVNIF